MRLVDAATEEIRPNEQAQLTLESLDVNDDSSCARQSTESDRLENKFEQKNDYARLTLQRTIELAIRDKETSLKGELPLKFSANVYGCQSQDKGYAPPCKQLPASEPFLRALRFVIEDTGAFFDPLLEDGICQQEFEKDFNRRLGLNANNSSSAMYYQQERDHIPYFFRRVTARPRNDKGTNEVAPPKYLRMLVLDCIQPDFDGTLFRYTPSNVVLQTFAKGWKQGPQTSRLASPRSLLLRLEPGLIGTILNSLHGAAFPRAALFVCKQLTTVARSGPNFFSKIVKCVDSDGSDDYVGHASRSDSDGSWGGYGGYANYYSDGGYGSF